LANARRAFAMPTGIQSRVVRRLGSASCLFGATEFGTIWEQLICLVQLSASHADSGKKVVNRDDVPQGRVHRVELRNVSPVWESIRQHAFGDRAGPSEKDVASVVESAARDAQASQSDEGVTPPVGEPGVPRDNRLAFPAADEIGIRGAVENGREHATLPLGAAEVLEQGLRGSASAGNERPSVVSIMTAGGERSQVRTPGEARSSM
jgi:hypothetical protein